MADTSSGEHTAANAAARGRSPKARAATATAIGHVVQSAQLVHTNADSAPTAQPSNPVTEWGRL